MTPIAPLSGSSFAYGVITPAGRGSYATSKPRVSYRPTPSRIAPGGRIRAGRDKRAIAGRVEATQHARDIYSITSSLDHSAQRSAASQRLSNKGIDRRGAYSA